MVDTDTPRTEVAPDRTKRIAALWATLVAVPVTLVVGVIAFATIKPDDPEKSERTPVAIPSTPVVMDAPQLDERTSTVCLAVTSQLPVKIRDLPARAVSAGPEQNAAFGEPAVTVACGVPQPETCKVPDDATPGCVPMDTELLIMNNVCWWAAPGSGGATITTMDREVPVRVTVPESYENPAQWANEFSDTIVKTVKSKQAGTMPSGCE
ncbi:DUF3515 domain-containing protein [Actinoplanes derwentensis]|uniref:DUF3515 domain-containing protein n=1 Tax=Actinoplanes derwentensis TaxID=113562 RepID=A0A1H2D4Z1_9ACTN|nr:DUF3515 domain-containing protein [Actinoplanes derwentensis]GID87972.1 hypothetical protein Ade03nite_68960 [Actinoplanes derwentensis]SDT77552.1 Protein of unknown function [Actinoplanes derwentensis]